MFSLAIKLDNLHVELFYFTETLLKTFLSTAHIVSLVKMAENIPSVFCHLKSENYRRLASSDRYST